ncbi:related to Alcohol dehydrogenase 4 [Zygosaccharomyces bailii ISA1307]|nr:related to Alcohol dehydrogenase 4 [Zygosaccharomyces bailii ISA1307]
MSSQVTGFYIPSISYFGEGAVKESMHYLKCKGFDRALIVTDPGITKIGVTSKVADVLKNEGVEVSIYDQTVPNPTIKNVDEGLAMLKKNSSQCVVSLGGGSAHDNAKAIALLATNGGKIGDYQGVNRSKKNCLPLFAINTTAGTASELTRFQTVPNPTIKNVDEGLAMLKKNSSQCVVSLGGGSAHDNAKAIALLATNGGEIGDYQGINRSKKNCLPLFAINTTAGTASELTRFTIITNEKEKIKMAIIDNNVTPSVAVNDPSLMYGLPPGLTAATGLDALTHCIEAFVSTAANPITDACAIKGMDLIKESLVECYKNGSDKKARTDMCYAEYLAGMAFNNASLGYVHALAHQLGGFYHLPHGICNAVLLPHVQNFNKNDKAAAKRLGEAALHLGAKEATPAGLIDQLHYLNQTMDIPKNLKALGAALHLGAKEATPAGLIDQLHYLNQTMDIPKNLKALGVKTSDFDILAEHAMNDACHLTNPIQFTKDEVKAILSEAYQ